MATAPLSQETDVFKTLKQADASLRETMTDFCLACESVVRNHGTGAHVRQRIIQGIFKVRAANGERRG